MANFKLKNLCDESSKIKNLRWQFSCIFRCLRRGVLRFFCSRRFHGEIPRSKLVFLQISKKDEKRAFLCGKIRPLEMIFFAFFPSHLLGPSERYVLHPWTLIGDSKPGFPAMIAERSKMIIFDHFPPKVLDKSPVRFSTTPLASLAGLNKQAKCLNCHFEYFMKTRLLGIWLLIQCNWPLNWN